MIFNYVAINKSGKRISGQREGNDQNEVVQYLTDQGVTVVSINEKIGVDFSKIANADIGGVPLKDKVVFVRQLATMISAGIPLIQALNILIEQTDKKSFKTKLAAIYKSIESGVNLSEAFKKEGGVFDEVQINLLASGEESGNLNEMLEKIATDLEKTKNLRGKLLGAMIYPAIIFTVMGVVLAIMIVFMVPQIKDLYSSLGQGDLPFVTQVLVEIGNFFANPASLIFIALALMVGYVIYRYAYSTNEGRLRIDLIKLRIPIFGNLSKKIEVTQFCRIMSMLLKSGIPIIDSIEIVSKALQNRAFSSVLLQVKEELVKGNSLAVSLAKFDKKGIYPIVLLRIVATGEEAGKLDKVLEDMGKFYEAEVEQITGNLTKLMEPIIMLIAGVLVAFMAVAVYLPIFQVGQIVST